MVQCPRPGRPPKAAPRGTAPARLSVAGPFPLSTRNAEFIGGGELRTHIRVVPFCPSRHNPKTASARPRAGAVSLEIEEPNERGRQLGRPLFAPSAFTALTLEYPIGLAGSWLKQMGHEPDLLAAL